MTETTVEAARNKTRQTALNKAYAAANKQLRENHLSEFNGLYRAHAANLGQDWKPKLTGAQKAAEDIKALLEQFPELADTAITKADEVGSAPLEVREFNTQ